MNIRDLIPDANTETAGRWFVFDDARFLIASNMNPEHRARIAKLAKTKYQKAMRVQDAKGIDNMTREALIGTVLLDWEGLKDGEKDLPFTEENAMMLLGIPTIREFVAVESQNVSNFIQKEDEALRGDLKSKHPVEPPVGGG